MNSLFKMTDILCTAAGEILEFSFRLHRFLPQYKFISKPIYKSTVNKIGEVWATAVSIVSTTTIMHNVLPVSISCLTNYAQSNTTEGLVKFYSDSQDICDFHFDSSTCLWMGFAGLVMFVKYKRLRNKMLYLNLPKIDVLKFLMDAAPERGRPSDRFPT